MSNYFAFFHLISDTIFVSSRNNRKYYVRSHLDYLEKWT